MKKVYVISNTYLDSDYETHTDIIHICADLDLAVEKANEYIIDSISDATSQDFGMFRIRVVADFQPLKYYTKDELLHSVRYLTLRDAEFNTEIETYDLSITEYELKED